MTTPKGIQRVGAVVQIGGVRLVEANAKTRVRSVKELGDATLNLTYGARVLAPPDSKGVFFIRAHMDAKVISDQDPKAEPYVEVGVGLELRYRLPVGFEASKDELRAFAQVNGVFNAWPYFREIIQTASARMDLPPIVIPLYRRPKANSGTTRKAQVGGAAAAKALPATKRKDEG